MEEEVQEDSDFSILSLLLIPATIVAVINIAFFNQIRNQLRPNPDQRNGDKRNRFAMFLGVNIFSYLIIAQLFLGNLYVPIIVCLILAFGVGYYLANYIFPEEQNQEVPELPIEEITREEVEETTVQRKHVELEEFGQEMIKEGKDEKVQLLEHGQRLKRLLNLLDLNESSKLRLSDQRVINEKLIVTEGIDAVRTFFYRLSVGQNCALQDLAENFRKVKDQKGVAGRDEGIRDILFGILTCCDDHLLQELLRNLAVTGNALPIILPTQKQNPVLLHWGLRRSFVSTEQLGQSSVVSQSFVTVSAIRFGKVGFSKSNALNGALSKLNDSESYYDAFLSEDKENAISKGVVECKWCLPKQREDDQERPLALLNLRGDSVTYSRQAAFCCKVSSLIIVFVEPPIHIDIENQIKHFAETTQIVLVFTKPGLKTPFETGKNVTVVNKDDLLDTNLAHIIHEHVAKPSNRQISFETFCKVCQELDIEIDEELPNCQTAKNTSKKIFDGALGHGRSNKDEQFPLHKLWKEWLAIDMEQIGADAIEHSISSKLQRKKEVRNLQKNAKLGEAFSILLGTFKGDVEYLHFVYSWLDILLENCAPMKQYEQPDLDQLDIHRFVEELSQVIECDHVVLRKEESLTGDEPLYPEKFACLFEEGISLLLCDTSENAIQIQWLGEVFDSLQSRTQADAKVCVVAAIGFDQTPIVSLLNQLFGVNFSFSTRSNGPLTQLVPFESPAKETIGCDFLLVINTELVNLEGDNAEQVQERNNFICALTTCLADVVLINTRELMTQQDTMMFLSTIVDSIEKMRDVNKSGKCFLVKTVKDNRTTSDTKHLSTLLFKETESNFKDILDRKGQERFLEDIVDVFSCDNENLTTVVRGRENLFSSNYHLDPADILPLRDSILQILGKLSRAPMSFSGFCQRLADVSKALKSKSFAENFQDTNLEKLNEEFVALYRGMLFKVRQELSENLIVACNDLRYTSSDIESTKRCKVHEMTQIVENKMSALQKNVSEMLHSTKYKCFLDQEHHFEQDIVTNKASFMEEVERSFQKVLTEGNQLQSASSKVKDEKQRFLQSLARNQLHNDSTPMIEASIEQTKEEFLTTIHYRYPLHKLSDIQEFTERNMKHFLSQCGKEVDSLLGNKSLSDCSSSHVIVSNPNDVKDISQRFNVANAEKQVLFDKIHSTVKSMSCKPESIDSNSKALCKLLKEVEEEFGVIVDPITMYLYFCSKFINEVHKAQIRKERDAVVSVDDVDFAEGNLSNYDLESKAVLILENLEIVCSKSDMMILREVITSSNITKCGMLPFTLITLQRLDRCFINMLPILSSDDMKSINNTMNETKMIMIARVLSKVCLDFGEAFNEVYRLIQRAIIDGEEGDRAKAAAIVHIAAWSSDLVSVKLMEDKKIQNVANKFEKDELKLCLAMNMTNHHINCDAIITEIVFEEIEMSLLRATEEIIMCRLRDQISVTSDVFNLKRLFIGNVLRDLCIKDEYLNFAYFFKDYDSFAQKWILEFIAKECNKVNASLLESLKKEIVDFYVKGMENVLDETVKEFQMHTAPKSLKLWLELFQKNMRTTCKTNCRMTVVEDLSTSTKVTDFHYFANTLRQAFQGLRPQIERSIVLPHVGNNDDTKTWLMTLPGDIHIDLAQIIKGCIEQCPFCGAACEKSIEGHEYHETELHYPGGLKSWHDVTSMKLFTEVCTSAVASNMRYRAPDFEFRPYSEYKKDYPNWNITPQVDEPNEFWKYIFNRFNSQFAKHYSCVQADIPEGWSKFTKEEAIRSVEKGYDLSPL